MKPIFGIKLKMKFEGNTINTIGIVCVALAVIFFIVYGVLSGPKQDELKKFPAVVVPTIYSQDLEKTIGEFEKIADTPVTVDPTDVGKTNPYF